MKAYRYIKNFIRLFLYLWSIKKLRTLMDSPVWAASEKAVQYVIGQTALQAATTIQERTPFCPRCGQIPDGDRRMDEAREILLTSVSARRHEADLALAFHYFLKKF